MILFEKQKSTGTLDSVVLNRIECLLGILAWIHLRSQKKYCVHKNHNNEIHPQNKSRRLRLSLSLTLTSCAIGFNILHPFVV